MFKVKIIITLLIIISILKIFLSGKTTYINSLFKGYNTSNINVEIKNNDYYMVIEIPDINLKKYIYDINDIRNNINLNVELLYQTDMLILVSHSGNGDNAYFKNLKYLEIGNIINIYFDNKKDVYIVSKIYSIKKTKDFGISEKFKNKLILITCLNKDHYLVVECQRQNS